MTVLSPGANEPGRTALRAGTGVAHPARVYNYWLGGTDNFSADRAAAEAAIAANPGIVADALANRSFLARAVRYLAAESGIRQFLDVGAGLPMADNTHQVAQAIAPESRIVYTDNDPFVLAHAGSLPPSTTQGVTICLDADLREPEQILERAAGTLDFTRPVALMLLIVLHLIPDDEHPRKIVARLMDALAPGSYLVLSHPARDVRPGAIAEMAERVNERLGGPAGIMRTYDQVAALFGGLDVIQPGVVQPQYWRPDATTDPAGCRVCSPDGHRPGSRHVPVEVTAWAGVARKP